MRLIACIVASVMFLQGNAQNSELIDSLKNRITSDISPIDELQANLDIAYEFLRYDLDSSEYYIDKAFRDQSIVNALPDTFFRHHLLKAWFHQGSYNLDSSKIYYEYAIDRAQYKKEKSDYIQLLLNYSSLLVDSKDENAFDYLNIVEEAIDTTHDLNHRIIWNLTYQLRSRAFENIGDYSNALSTLLTIMRVPFFKDLTRYRFGVFNSFSVYLKEIGDIELSRKYLIQALEQPGLSGSETKRLLANLLEQDIDNQKIDSAQVIIGRYDNLSPHTDAECQRINYLKAKLAFISENFNSGKNFLTKSIECNSRVDDVERTLYLELLNAQYALHDGNQVLVTSIITKIDLIAAEYPAQINRDIKSKLEELRLKSQLLITNPILLSNVDTLLNMQKLKYQDRTDRQLKELAAKFENEKKDASIIALKKEGELLTSIARNRGIATLMAFLVALLASFLVWILRRSNRIEKERNLLLEDQKDMLELKVDELEEYNSNLVKKQEELKVALLKEYNPIKLKKRTDAVLEDPLTINYIIAHMDGVKVFFIDKTIPAIYNDTLKDTLTQLPDNLFIQIKRGTIVNISRLKKINHNSVTLIDHTILDVGGTYKGNLQVLKNTFNSP